MEVKQVLHLNCGDGDLGLSYPKNSRIQKKSGVGGGKKAIREAIVDYYRLGASSDVFVVADLGCASGGNTLSFVSDVITTVKERCKQLGRCPPTFLAFLNDLPGSDFNTLFRSLPKQWTATGGGGRGEAERCFVAGVPGSFFGRLFPSNSVHLFHSAFAAHFLSQVPPELESGQIVNRGWAYASRSSANCASEAYYRQFQRDFSTFLRARAEEMVIGGSLLMFLMGRGEGDPLTSCMESYVTELMAEILVDMASKGLIEEEKIGYFNFPIYFASASEVELEIQKEGSFSIKCLEVFPSELLGVQPQTSDIIEGNDKDQHLDACRDTKGVVFARSLRAILEPMLAAHMGGEIMETLFKRFAKTLDKYFLSNKAELPTLLVSLERIYA